VRAPISGQNHSDLEMSSADTESKSNIDLEKIPLLIFNSEENAKKIDYHHEAVKYFIIY
jgi:hypothetical protein